MIFSGNQTRNYKCFWGGSAQGCEWTFSVKKEIGNDSWFEGEFPKEEKKCTQALDWSKIKDELSDQGHDISEPLEMKGTNREFKYEL